MEEKKTQRKLSYEELSKAASDLHVQYQKLMAEYQKAMEALRNKDFEYTSFFLSTLFRVMDKPEAYDVEFTKWCSEQIQEVVTAFYENMTSAKSTEKAVKGEAE